MQEKNLPTPPHKDNSASKKKERNSNLELYRIIVMLLIVAHHYVVNSGLFHHIQGNGDIVNSGVMLLFGAWGKTGINCFVLITGYFMCTAKFSLEKLIKLYLQIIFYALIIYGIFCITGQISSPSLLTPLWILWPIKSLTSNDFVSCFLMFYLFIPILNNIISYLDKNIYIYLLIILSIFYGLLPSIPIIIMTFSYVNWFMAIYLMAAYIRLYGFFPGISHNMWGNIALILILIGSVSILGMVSIYKLGYINTYAPYFFVADSNKFLSLAIAISSFMYFKDLKIPHSRFINAVGGATFGVLLIHANSEAMLQWLWRETVDSVGHFGDSILLTLGYAMVSVLIIFTISAGIEWFRGKFIEPRILNFVNSKLIKVKQKLPSFLQ